MNTIARVAVSLREVLHIGIKKSRPLQLAACAEFIQMNDKINERAALPQARPFQLGEPDSAGPANA